MSHKGPVFKIILSINILNEEKDINWETDWKLTLFQEFETPLFELKLLRPAFALLFALLPTMRVLFFKNNRVSVT